MGYERTLWHNLTLVADQLLIAMLCCGVRDCIRFVCVYGLTSWFGDELIMLD